MADASVTFENFSDVDFTLHGWDSSMSAALDSLTQTPSGELKAHSGHEVIAMEQDMLSFMSRGDVDLECSWRSQQGQFFGVKIRVPFQEFYLGTAPHWYVSSALDDDGNPVWEESGDDPAEPYEWHLPGLDIRASPTAGHSDLSIDVIVQTSR